MSSKPSSSGNQKPNTGGNQIQIPSWQAKAFEEWVKTVLIADVVDHGNSIVELYCGRGLDIGKWQRAQISYYVAFESNKEQLDATRQRWIEKQKPFEAEFLNFDPTNQKLIDQLPSNKKQFNAVCSFQGFSQAFDKVENATNLLKNISNILKPKGIFFGIVIDSSSVWYKSAGQGTTDKEKLYTLELGSEQFTEFGTKYSLKLEGLPEENGYLVHFPSLIQIAKENKLRMLDISNFHQFYDDRKRHYGELLAKMGVFTKQFPTISTDQKNVMSLFTTFVFQKE